MFARFPDATVVVSDSQNFYEGEADGTSRFAQNGLLDGKLKFRPLMIPDTFTEQASQNDMYAAAGLDRAGIVATVLDTLGRAEPRAVNGGEAR